MPVEMLTPRFFVIDSGGNDRFVDFEYQSTNLARHDLTRAPEWSGCPIFDPDRVFSMAGWRKNICLAESWVRDLVRSAGENRECLGVFLPEGLSIFDTQRRIGREVFYDPEWGDRIGNMPERLIKPSLRFILPLLDATLIHAAGLLDADNRAILLLGPPGAGKSTAMALGRSRFRVLGDDRILVRRTSDGFVAAATPFNHETDGPALGRVTALVALKKERRFSVSSCSPLAVLGETWGEADYVWSEMPPVLRRALFEIYWGLFTTVPVFQMDFTREFVDWDAVLAAIEKRA